MQQNNRGGRGRVVVTGTGLITPLGHNVPDSWEAILAGRSGFADFTIIEKGDLTIGGACEVKDFNAADYVGRRKARRRDRFQLFAAVAAAEAIEQSGLEIDDENRERIGISIGTGIGGIRTLVAQESVFQESGVRRLSPFAIPKIMANGAAGMMAIDYGIHGPSTTIATACASGSDAIGYAFKMIRYGELDVVVTGGTEAIITSVALGGFERAGATSMRASNTPSPFDKNRDGLIPGEGAGMLVLESLDFAEARGAGILAEVVGYGQTTDAFHITAPSENGIGAIRAIRQALADAEMDPSEIDYVSAHGTGTQLNDSTESSAIKSVLGEGAYDVAISSTKSMTGHIMGATGAIEMVFCALAVRDQVVPPTINYETPDPECDLDYVPNEARDARVRATMNNAFGFGGHNAVLILKEFEG
jgi:3-oxoacyl-[acyl-carrier-protein] synthase II